MPVPGLGVGPQPPGWPEAIPLRTCQGRDLPFPDARFDVVWSNSCLEHVRHPKLTIEEVHRALRPGGTLVSSIYLRDHFCTDRRLDAEHLRHPSWLWRAMMWNRSMFTNAPRWNGWQILREDAGFQRPLFEREPCDALGQVYASHPARHCYTRDEFEIVRLFFVVLKRRPA